MVETKKKTASSASSTSNSSIGSATKKGPSSTSNSSIGSASKKGPSSKSKSSIGSATKEGPSSTSNSKIDRATKKGPSVRKTLTALIQSTPSNRSCADCRSALVDPSNVFASFCPSQEATTNVYPEVAVAFHDFQLTHRALAPPDILQRDPSRFGGADPALLVNQRFGGHGVFICAKCAEAHKRLGTPITKVQGVQDARAWAPEQAQFMKSAGGNQRCWTVYEAYLPESWKKRRPNPSSSLAERILFCRAKYEALAFCLPPPGPLSELAWLSILQRNEAAGGKRHNYTSLDLKNIHSLTASPPTSPKSTGPAGELPNRLIDHFCVVSCSMQLHPRDLEKDLSTVRSPEDLQFWPHIADCFPVRTAHSDTIFPEHLPSFVLPEGCHPNKTQKPPAFYTFVLTQGDGNRLYGGALQIHDETMETEGLREVILDSGYEGAMPSFLDNENDDDDGSDIVFFPKCLVLLSHHPFFHLFREALLQIYRITLMEAPLPIERYIANLTCEVPLPPQGKIKVEFGFTTEKQLTIERPPMNRLPMANFSFRPLFASLSVSNILVVLGCLMEECQVALLSQHFSLLCPVAEALLCSMFPFEWQGLYIPVMPYSMLDILDAPVPFLVGLDSRYLHETLAKHRPRNVVFVDLDRDVVHMGFDEITGKKRSIPELPPRDAIKLKGVLEEAAGPVYLMPNNGIKGCVMAGVQKMVLIPNEERPKYAQMRSVALDEDSLVRNEMFSKTEKAYDDQDLEDAFSGFRTLHGQLKDDDDNSFSSGGSQGVNMLPRMRKPKFLRNKKLELLSKSNNAKTQAHLLDMTEPDGFSSSEIRNAFLRFFVTTFVNYERFLLENAGRVLFDEDKFVKDLQLDLGSLEFLKRVLNTQMFQRFLEERKENPGDPEIRFFDESISAKHNRSKKTTLANGGKFPTPFLDSESWKVTKTFTPPQPSNLGLLDVDTSYHYNTFPALDYSLFGRARPTMMWTQERSQHSLRFKSTKNTKVRVTQQEIVKKAMRPFVIAPIAIAAVARRSARDLESALASLSPAPVRRDRKDASRRDREDSSGSNTSKSSKEFKSKTPTKRKKETKSNRPDDSVKIVGSGESTGSDRLVNTLTRADTIMINARRKQAILLDLVIKLQAACRMFMAWKRYTAFKRSVICLQRKFQDAPLPKPEDKNLAWQMVGVTRLQRNARTFLARMKAHQIKQALRTIQRFGRGYIVRRRFAILRQAAITIQKCTKARRTRFLFQLTRNIVSKVQARVRGIQVRGRLAIVMEQRMAVYRNQIFTLWHLSHVPLSLRTKLWPQFADGLGFTRLRLAESELSRLWGIIGMDTSGKGNAFQDDTTRLSDFIGIGNKTYCTCKKNIFSISHSQLPDSSAALLQNSLEVEEAERLQVHERLDSKVTTRDIGSIYKDFDIPTNEKMKKASLAKVLWTTYQLADRSGSTMILLFPELEGSLNMAFHNPSTKSKRRFPNACTIASPPVEKIFWDEVSLEGTVKKHVKEVSSIYITKVPSLMAKLQEFDAKKQAEWSTMQAAALNSHGSKSWAECQRHLIVDYIAGRDADMAGRRKAAPIPDAEFPDIDCPPASKTTGIYKNGGNPIDAANFPDIQLVETDSSEEADFPNINMDGLDGGNPIETANFPTIDTVKSAAKPKFPDII